MNARKSKLLRKLYGKETEYSEGKLKVETRIKKMYNGLTHKEKAVLNNLSL